MVNTNMKPIQRKSQKNTFGNLHSFVSIFMIAVLLLYNRSINIFSIEKSIHIISLKMHLEIDFVWINNLM